MRLFIFVALLAASAAAQLQPGTFLTLTTGDATQKSIRHVDRFAGTSTALTITGLPMETHGPRDLFIEDAKNFLLAMDHTPLAGPDQGHVFRVTWDDKGKSWKATQLNTAPMVPRTVAVTRVKDTIYLSGGSPGNGSAHDATLWQLPAKGGKPVVSLALGKKCTPTPGPASGSGGSIIAVGTTLHWIMWDATGSGVEHWSIDTTKNPPVAKLTGTLPMSKRIAFPILPVGICWDPASYIKPGGVLIIGSRTGDALWRDRSGKNILHVAQPGTMPPTYPFDELMNSIGVNTDTGAVAMGDWNCRLEELRCGSQGTWALNVQKLNLPKDTKIQDMEYIPSGSTYRKDSNGCFHQGGIYPCNYLTSLPVPGTSNFGLTVKTPGTFAVILFGLTSNPKHLQGWGAPGCWLWPSVGNGVILPGTSIAGGFAFKTTIPASMQRGWLAHVQWLVADPKANALGLVVSDSRKLIF